MNHKDKKIKNSIEALLGKPYSFGERIRMGGIGSSKLQVEDMSEGMKRYFGTNLDSKFVSIELRPKGILIYIKNKVNDYAWAIPYYKLSIFQCSHFSIHSSGNFLKINIRSVYPKNKKLIDKVMTSKNEQNIKFSPSIN